VSKNKKNGDDAQGMEDPPEAISSGCIWIEPLLSKSKENVLSATDSAIADATARSEECSLFEYGW
jgi:hypothetical protein